jgi:F1F0 ATPase subunit 2
MSESLSLALAWAAGLLLGATYFGGLWWTVRRAVSSARPARLFLGSLLVRAGVAIAGFYLVGRGHWKRMALCLVAFIVAREIVKVLTRPTVKRRDLRMVEAHDES